MTDPTAAESRKRLPMHWKIAIGFAIGIAAGLLVHVFVGADAGWVKLFIEYFTQPFSTIFLRLIFMLVLPLLFSALVVGIGEMGDVRALGRIGWRTLLYTTLLSALAVLIGLLLVNWLKPGAGVDSAEALHMISEGSERAQAIANDSTTQPKGLQMLIAIVPDNVVKAAAENTILAVMFFALMLGVGLVLTRSEATATLKRGIEGLFEVSMTLIGLVIRLAPVAVFCLMFNLAAQSGVDLLLRLGAYVAVVVLALAIHLFVVYSLALKLIGGWSPLAFFRGVQEAMLMAFSTASSNATLPTSLRVADERLGLPKQVSRFVLTVGATANQNGTALFEGVTVLFLAQYFGVELTLVQQVTVMLVCILGGIGTAGVPSGSLPVVALICAMVGVPVEGIGLILGVNHFLDMCRTTVNVTGDLGIAAMVAGRPGPSSITEP
ncbi:MAG: dicarboxylate/amino acid:cation symporter [Lysobacteraceae bacterium]|nr:MAG: dicarboxylate/amino acid:cation symporter [Xanthomonadaceae bacterium]